jgi:hypothetical protein
LKWEKNKGATSPRDASVLSTLHSHLPRRTPSAPTCRATMLHLSAPWGIVHDHLELIPLDSIFVISWSSYELNHDYVLFIEHSYLELNNLDAHLDFHGIHSEPIQYPSCITYGTYFHIYDLMKPLVHRNCHSLLHLNIDTIHPWIFQIFFIQYLRNIPSSITQLNN